MATTLSNSPPHQAPPLQSSLPPRPPHQPALPVEQNSADVPEPVQPAVPPQEPMGLVLAALVTLALLAALFLLQGCNRGEEPAAAAAPEMIVVETAAPQEAAILPTPVPVVYSAGQVVTSGTEIAVVGDAAGSAPVLEVYAAGSSFTVLEPGLDKGAYPILADGASWVRVRAGDGLAGWVNALLLAQ